MIAITKKRRNLNPRKRQYISKIHSRPDGECSELDHLNADTDLPESRTEDWNELLGLSLPADEEGLGASESDGGTESDACTFAGVDISDLAPHANEKVDWIVQGVFSSDQPIIFGAGSKCTKTLHLTDLSVALTKPPRKEKLRKWLGRFKVKRRRRVLFITAESNKRATAKLFAKCAKAHGTTLEKMKGYLRVETVKTPKLASILDLDALTKDVQEHEFDVVILDPLYPSLAGMDGNQLEDRGAAIRDLYLAVQPATVIISHHFTKSASRNYGDRPYLEDLNGAGLAESAGNWWLMKRNVPYSGDHVHDLVVNYGGRDGQSGLVRIEFNEEEWHFDVEDYEEYLQDKRLQDIVDKSKEKEKQVEFDSYQLREYFSEKSSPAPKTTIRDEGPLSGRRFTRAFDRLVKDETIIATTYLDNSSRKQTGWCLREGACSSDDCEDE